MKRKYLLLLPLLAAFLTGCPRNQYVIEMKPDGDGLTRTLTCWREDGQDTNGNPAFVDFPEEERIAIASRYPEGAHKKEGPKHTFVAKLHGETPDDVGGRGTYSVYPSSLGVAFVYVERFRGDDDLYSKSESEIKAADQLVDMIIQWSRAELGKHPQYPHLQRFLDTRLRHDLRNASRYGSMAKVLSTSQPAANEEFVARYGQYLAEHGYVTAQDLPVFWRAASTGDAKPLMVWVQRLVARELGVPLDESLTKALAFLGDEESAKNSLENLLRGTEEYEARLKRWEAERKTNSDASKPQALDLPGELLAQAVGLDGGNSGDQLTVELVLPVQPIQTNGRWDPKRGAVVWEATLEQKPGPFHNLPTFSYAAWSLPNEQAQHDRFGQNLLKGNELLAYCLWCGSLTPGESEAWEKALLSCQPGNLQEKLSGFPESPRQLIESALKEQARADKH